MPRPCKRRKIEGSPSADYFKPRGIKMKELEEVELSIDEFEAIRLKDYLGKDQAECAEQMGISQPTFHRLLIVARKKLSESIIMGKALKITKDKK